VHDGEDRHRVSGSMGVSGWALTGTTRDGREVVARSCHHHERRDGEVVRDDSCWKNVDQRSI